MGDGDVPKDSPSASESEADDALRSSPRVAADADGLRPDGAGAEQTRPGPRGEGLRNAAADRSEPNRKPRSAGNGLGVWGE